MSILKPSDFTGFHQPAGSDENDELLQAYIDKHESKCVKLLFGIEMGKLILADIALGATSPTNADYQKVWEPFEEVGSSDQQWISEGVLEILKSYIFWHYIIHTAVQHTQAGTTTAAIDTQQKGNPMRFAESRWNYMLDSWDAIQEYIAENESTYPDYLYIEPPDPKFDGVL